MSGRDQSRLGGQLLMFPTSGEATLKKYLIVQLKSKRRVKRLLQHYRPEMIRLGFEIPVNKHFYIYKPPRPLDQIERDIIRLEGEIAGLLKGLMV